VGKYYPTAYGTSRPNAPLTPEPRGGWKGFNRYSGFHGNGVQFNLANA